MRRLIRLMRFEENVYIYCREERDLEILIEQAEEEGIRFGDGTSVRERRPDRLMTFCPDGTLCYPSGAVHMLKASRGFDRIVIDLRKYLNGDKEYFYSFHDEAEHSRKKDKKQEHQNRIRERNRRMALHGTDMGFIDRGEDADR